jgi:phosphoserine phosphatase
MEITPTSTKAGYAIFDLDRTLTPWTTPLLFCNFVLKKKNGEDST